MQIPAKIQHGEKVISTVFDKINGIIDYLNASRIRKGPGILVDESPSGTVIKLADNRPATPPQVLPAGSGGASGLTATVSGGIASVSVSGSSPLSIIPGSNVTISGTTGGIILDAQSLSGLPDYDDTANIDTFQIVGPGIGSGSTGLQKQYNHSVWLIGTAEASETTSDVQFSLQINIGAFAWEPIRLQLTGHAGIPSVAIPFAVPVPANTLISFAAYDDCVANVNAIPML